MLPGMTETEDKNDWALYPQHIKDVVIRTNKAIETDEIKQIPNNIVKIKFIQALYVIITTNMCMN